MKTWKIITRFTPEHATAAELPAEQAAADQETLVVDDELQDEAAVRAYAAENWRHMVFVSAQEVPPAS